jgi:anti-anti-sigma factor
MGQPGGSKSEAERDVPMETFELGAWDDGAVHVVRVSGEFDISACGRFRDASEHPEAELLVVDLRETTFLDSSALSELIRLHRRTDGWGSRLAILRPRGQADRIFKLTGIDGHLPLYDERVPVLAEFNFG